MKSKSPRPPTARLRRRQILILGQGASVLAFCRAFRSDWAEVTVVSESMDYAPQVVRHGVAAGLLQRKDVANNLSEGSGKLKGIRLEKARVARVDPDARRVYLEGGAEPLPYDFLLLGSHPPDPDGPSSNPVSLETLAQAERFHEALRTAAMKPNLRVLGSDTAAIDLASSLTRPATGKSSATPKVILQCSPGFEFANRKLKPKVEHRFAQHLRWEAISLLDAKTLDRVQDEAIELVSQQASLPLWLRTWIELPPNAYASPKEVRPDLRLRAHERIYLLPELVQVVDSVGRAVPKEDSALLQQGRYLARLLRGMIERRRGFTVDQPGFVYRDGLQLATVRNGKSVGFVGHHSLPATLAYGIDVVFAKYPVFRCTYGTLSGARQLLHWLRCCK